MVKFLKWISIALFIIILLISSILFLAYRNKKQILALVLIELKTTINGEILIKDIDFGFNSLPRLSIILKEFELRDPAYKIYKKQLLKAEKVYLNIDLWPLLKNKIIVNSITIKNGDISIFKTKNGYNNLDTFKKSPNAETIDTSNSLTLNLKKIELINIKSFYNDSLKNKHISINFIKLSSQLNKDKEQLNLSLVGKFITNQFELNPKNGSFGLNTEFDAKINAEYYFADKSIIINASELKTNNSSIAVNGFVNDSIYNFEFATSKINYIDALKLLPIKTQKKLKEYNCDKPIKVKAIVSGDLAISKETKLDIEFEIKESFITAKKLTFEKVNLTAKYSNSVNPRESYSNKNSSITMKNAFLIKEGIPTKFEATISNLDNPFLLLKSDINYNCKALNELLDEREMKFTDGNYKIHIDYEGNLFEYLESKIDSKSGKLNGTLDLKNVSFKWIKENQLYSNLNGSFNFSTKQISINKINFLVNNNPINLSGVITNFLPFFSNQTRKGYVSLSVFSPRIDLKSILSNKKKAEKKIEKDKTGNKILTNLIEKLYENLEFDLKIRINELNFNKFIGQELKADLKLADNILTAKNLDVQVAGGKIDASLIISDLDKDVNPILFNGKVVNTDISKFFVLFNNFNQKAITNSNLEGKLSADVNFVASVDEKLAVVPKTMGGKINLEVINGKLIQFEPMKNMSNFLLKNRDFETVSFDDLNMEFELKGNNLDISRMEIASNLINLFVEGQYGFGKETDFSVQIPLSNLKKRDKNYEPENIGLDEKTGASVFLHIYNNEVGKTIIAYDPFKKHIKSKELKPRIQKIKKRRN